MSDDTPNPDWVVWLARAEAEASGDDAPAADDRIPCAECGRLILRDDRYCGWCGIRRGGWQRLGDVAAKVVAGLIGGAILLALIGAALYAARGFN